MRANGAKGMAQCPAHEDRDPSLSIRRIEGSVLLHCHGSCHTDDVLAAINLSKRDLYDEPKGATYAYDNGRLVHRSPDKQFSQSGDTRGTGQLYRLAKVTAAVEGPARTWRARAGAFRRRPRPAGPVACVGDVEGCLDAGTAVVQRARSLPVRTVPDAPARRLTRRPRRQPVCPARKARPMNDDDAIETQQSAPRRRTP